MNSQDLLADGFERIREAVHGAVEGLSPEDVNARLDADANSIAWLVWHLTRIQDDHVADAADVEQVWFSQDWAARFELPFPKEATGYGHSSKQVAAVRVQSAELLLGYYDAVHEQTVGSSAGSTTRRWTALWTRPGPRRSPWASG